jgi:hypothetical protein
MPSSASAAGGDVHAISTILLAATTDGVDGGGGVWKGVITDDGNESIENDAPSKKRTVKVNACGGSDAKTIGECVAVALYRPTGK